MNDRRGRDVRITTNVIVYYYAVDETKPTVVLDGRREDIVVRFVAVTNNIIPTALPATYGGSRATSRLPPPDEILLLLPIAPELVVAGADDIRRATWTTAIYSSGRNAAASVT